MPEVTLQAYEDEINQLIEDARYIEALAHSRHILSEHPRYVGVYYLLGKTMLEADQPELAIDLFRRALNGDPEHLMSRIGLALAYQRVNNLDAAIWNLERAVEIDPGNADLADELCQLYGRRDGIEPSYIPLNRAGLARLYLRGNRPGRAVEELRALVSEEPDRIDLQLLLAEAYWRDDQIVQAADICQAVQENLRYCLKANLLLGTLWTNSGQEEGQAYLNRAQEVDLENVLAGEMFGSSAPLQPRELKIERLVYSPDAIAEDTEAKWFKQLEAASVTVGISEAMPEMTESEMALVDITAGLESQIAIPDWLAELGDEEGGGLSWMADIGGDALEAEAADVGTPEWLQTGEAEAIEAAQEMPDWLGELRDGEGAAEADLGFGEPPAAVETDAPDWLSDAGLGTGETEGVPEWLGELGAEVPEDVAGVAPPATEAMPDWLSALQPAETPETGEEAAQPTAEVPDWLQELQPEGTETAEPAADEEPKGIADWLREQQTEAVVAEETETEAAAVIAAIEAQAEEKARAIEEGEIPDWLADFQPDTPTGEPSGIADLVEQEPVSSNADVGAVAATEPGEIEALAGEGGVEAADVPDWLSILEPSGAEATTAADEDDLLAWLDDIQPEAETTTLQQESRSAELPDFGSEGAEAELTLPAEEPSLDWEVLAEELTESEPETPSAGAVELSTPAETVVPTAEGDLLSGDDALAWLESLTEGKEDELRAQAEVESQARVDEILGRKAEPAVEPQAGVTEAGVAPEPEPVVEAPVAAEVAPTAEGDLLSGDDALAWLESLTEGKEDELRAQAEVESQARVDEILGRKAEPAVEPEPAIAEGTPTAEVSPPEDEAFFGWDAFGEEAAEAKAPAGVEESAVDWESLADELEKTGDVTAAAPTAEGDLLSGDDALAWLESLTEGKEDELRAQAEMESQARVDEILGRKAEPAVEPEPAIAEGTPTAEVSPPEDEAFFGWDAFGEEAAEAEAPAGVEESAVDWEALADELEKTGDVTAAPTAEGDLLSGDDALAWLESLTAGKEDELRAQAEVEAQARVDEILGRAPEPAAAPVVEEAPEPAVAEEAPAAEAPTADETFFGWDAFGEEVAEAEAPAGVEERAMDWEALAEELEATGDVTAAAPTAEGDLLSGDDALAWLESLTAGKEDELRAQAEVESQARVDEILGRKPEAGVTKAGVAPEPEPVVETPVAEQVAPTAEGDLLSGDDALAWLESLTAGKEDKLRAQAEVEAQARVNEILGRKPEAGVEPEPVVEAPVAEEVAPTAEGDLLSGDDALAWLESLTAGKEDELRAQAEVEAQARVNEILGRKPEAPPPPEFMVAEPTAEPEPVIAESAPVSGSEHVVPPTPELAEQPEAASASDLDALRSHVQANDGDHAARLSLARALLKAGAVDEAMENYALLVQANAEIPDVMADLRRAVEAHPQDMTVLQTLGDAYMAQGLVDQALETYNQAMNLL